MSALICRYKEASRVQGIDGGRIAEEEIDEFLFKTAIGIRGLTLTYNRKSESVAAGYTI